MVRLLNTQETKQWWLNGKFHREDGPAIEYPSGTKEWYLNDEEVTAKMVPCYDEFGEKNEQT
jgi:hypothetical protein